MAPSELADIRALLIAQTETPEPRRSSGLFGAMGGLLKPRGGPPAPTRPLTLAAPSPRRAPVRPPLEPDHTTLLLGEEIDPELFMPIELPRPPRAEFGVRSPRPYLPHDSVLLLNKVAPAQPRRLTLLTDTGEAVGEIFLARQAAPDRARYLDVEDCEAPYFPGDLEEGLTASPAPAPAPLTARKIRCPHLERDLLTALAVALSREHDVLREGLIRAGCAPA